MMGKRVTNSCLHALAACLCAVALVAPAFGQEILFDGGPAMTGMDYLTGENWVGDNVPAGPGQTAIMGDPAQEALNPAVVNLGADAPPLFELKVGRGALGTGTLNHTAGAVVTDNWVVIGDGGTGATPSNGTYNLTGTASLTPCNSPPGACTLGLGAGGGIGTLNIGTPAVRGGGPSVTSQNGVSLGVGADSVGVVNQYTGTVNSNWLNIGQEGGGNGTYNMSGGSVAVEFLSVGENDPGTTGTFNVSGSSVLDLGNIRIGTNGNTTGTLNLTGGDVSFTADQFSVASNDGSASENTTGNVNFISDGGNGEGVGLSTINVTGNVTLNDGLGSGSTANLGIDLSNGDPGGDLLLINVGGTLTGQFTGLPEGMEVPGSNGRFITYNYLGVPTEGGGQVIALVIPEPSCIVMVLAGLIGLGFIRRR